MPNIGALIKSDESGPMCVYYLKFWPEKGKGKILEKTGGYMQTQQHLGWYSHKASTKSVINGNNSITNPENLQN